MKSLCLSLFCILDKGNSRPGDWRNFVQNAASVMPFVVVSKSAFNLRTYFFKQISSYFLSFRHFGGYSFFNSVGITILCNWRRNAFGIALPTEDDWNSSTGRLDVPLQLWPWRVKLTIQHGGYEHNLTTNSSEHAYSAYHRDSSCQIHQRKKRLLFVLHVML